ncbi:unnamed protein product [Allacma fusca]|uniref:BUB1 N-terminal domain-containing protein n=1 Tax=Allacma fusca TaxID=39272 RepID=A0A8J2MG91_9HEXA|nr:unnamed protein product [Allacma fusca]
MIEAAGGSDWELSKENIQPLSSGRKMSFLTHSLDESEFARISREMEDQIKEYNGPDPLEPWMKYIEFLEQSCPTGGKTNAKYDHVLHRCFQFFSQVPEYRDDKRVVEVYLKAVQNFPAVKRAEMIQGILNRGFGVTVSRTYLAIADALEASQNFSDAIKFLKSGIEAGAQPVEYLEDALTNLQFRVAQRIAQNMQRDDEESIRNFGASVPVCKLTNEAQNIRVALSPGNPCRARPISNKKLDPKIPLFRGFNEADEENAVPQTAPFMLPSQETEMMQSEQENIMKPKKWCNEFLPPPPSYVAENLPSIDIYVDEPENQPRKEELSRKIDRGILSERKIAVEEAPSVDDFVVQKIPYRKNQLDLGRDREISFEHMRSKEYLKRVGVTTLRALVGAKRKAKAHSNTQVLAPKVEPSFVVPTRVIHLSSRTRDTSACVVDPAEQQRVQKERAELENIIIELKTVEREKSEVIQEQRSVIAKLENDLVTERQGNTVLSKDMQELRGYIKIQEKEHERLMQENQKLRSELISDHALVERLQREIEEMRQQFDEEKHKLLQEFDRERNESLLSFRIDHRSIIQEEEKIAVTAEINKNHTSPVPFKPQGVIITNPIPPSQKLGFTLYESNIDGVEEDVQPVNLSTHKSLTGKNPYETSGNLGRNISQNVNSNMQHDFAMPLPRMKQPSKQLEDDKENMSSEGNRQMKQSRPLSGVLLPSTTAEPTELVYNEEEDDEIMLKNPEGTVDFNVTDLTRALQLYPRPLINSTPEKINTDLTCDMPVNYMNLLRRQPFSTAALGLPRLDAGLSSPVIENALKLNIEPLHYEDEQNFGNQKENSFNCKPEGISYAPELVHHLSPIPEASKERWSSCTSSSSSTNMTNTRGTNFSVGSSYNVTKSVSRIVGRLPNVQRSVDAFQPPRSHTFDNTSQNQN